MYKNAEVLDKLNLYSIPHKTNIAIDLSFRTVINVFILWVPSESLEYKRD
jgi:hypothetical protein